MVATIALSVVATLATLMLIAAAIRFLPLAAGAIREAINPQPSRHSRVTWKVVKLDGPIQKNLNLNVQYGVIISTDEMMRGTHALLFCPLIDGLYEGTEIGMDPWHVEITEIDSRGGRGQLPSRRMLMSTKIVLPVAPEEINTNRIEYGYLTPAQQQAASRKFRAFLPNFAAIAGNIKSPGVSLPSAPA